jgi:hypothetical protein
VASAQERTRRRQRHVRQILRCQRARGGSGPVIADGGTRLLDHQAGRTPRVAADPSRVDPFARQAIQDAIARRISTETAHPRGPQTEPRQTDARIAFGAGMVDKERRGRRQRLARGWREGDHGFTEGDHVKCHKDT